MSDMSRKYSQELKRYVVEQFESGHLNRADLCNEYGISRANIKNWLEEYGKFRPQKSIVEVVMKSEKDKIAELEKALSEAHLKIRFYDELIKIADKDLKTDLKKTIGAKLSGSSKEPVIKSARSVKSSK
jgi:transposase